jgi:ankyrin repeat protein
MAAPSNTLPENTLFKIDELIDVEPLVEYIDSIPNEDINKPINKLGYTLLFTVLRTKNPGKERTAAVKKLIEKGADVNKLSKFRGKETSPLELAVKSSDRDVTKLLYDNGAIIDNKIISLFNNLKRDLEKNKNYGINRVEPQEYKRRSDYVDWFKNFALERRGPLLTAYETGPMGTVFTKTGGRRRATQKVRRNKRKHTRRIHRAYRN